MISFIVNCLLWTLAIYGLIDILKIIRNNFIHKRIESSGIFVIVAAKNQEHQIEGFLRSVIYNTLCGKDSNINRIIVTDINSEDATGAILEKFSEDYKEITYYKWEDCKKKLDGLE